MMKEDIERFNEQFGYEPELHGTLPKRSRYLVCGMGGSHIAADMLRGVRPDLPLSVWSDYELPFMTDEEAANTLVVASSHSGNTEETISAFEAAQARGIAAVAVGAGGKLLDIADENATPFIRLPASGLQPRLALGHSVKAMALAGGAEGELPELSRLKESLNPAVAEEKGRRLAERLHGSVPVVYASRASSAVAYAWKIKLNESAKIPAFMNIFPELNHNEMNGFDTIDSTRDLSGRFGFVFLRDGKDEPRIQKRVDETEKMFRARGFAIENVLFEGESLWEKSFNSLLLADWTSWYLAETYGTEPELVPMVEELKRLL